MLVVAADLTARKNVPNVEGAITRNGNTSPVAPALNRTASSTNASMPRRPINVAGTISPASMTSVSSSKDASMLSIARDTPLTESAS